MEAVTAPAANHDELQKPSDLTPVSKDPFRRYKLTKHACFVALFVCLVSIIISICKMVYNLCYRPLWSEDIPICPYLA